MEVFLWLIAISSTVSGFELTVFNLNTLGNSYFDDLPIPSETEPYNVSSIKEETSKFLEDNYPNPALLFGFTNSLDDAQLVGFINPARKKKERFQGICDHLKNTRPDVVFLQEVWYQKDYNFLKQCLDGSGYQFSDFDPTCGHNPMSQLKCSGLVTLSQFPLEKEFWVPLRKGNDYGSLTNIRLYLEYALVRKALFHNIKVNGVSIDIVNTHLIPYYGHETENRILRRKQAKDICWVNKHRTFDLAILGMDMNDKKMTPVFKTFKRAGFVDLFNAKLKNPITFAHPDNNVVGENEEPATLDYIMIKEALMKNGIATIKEMKMETLKTDSGISFSDHETLSASFEVFI